MLFKESKMIPDSSMVGRVDARSPTEEIQKDEPSKVCAQPWKRKEKEYLGGQRNATRCFSAGSLGITLGFSVGVL